MIFSFITVQYTGDTSTVGYHDGLSDLPNDCHTGSSLTNTISNWSLGVIFQWSMAFASTSPNPLHRFVGLLFLGFCQQNLYEHDQPYYHRNND